MDGPALHLAPADPAPGLRRSACCGGPSPAPPDRDQSGTSQPPLQVRFACQISRRAQGGPDRSARGSDEHGGQGAEGPAAVADGVLLVGRHLAEGAAARVCRRGRRARTPGRSRSRPRRARSAAIVPLDHALGHDLAAVGVAHQGHRAEPGPPRPRRAGPDPVELGAAAWPRCRRRWRARRRSGPSGRRARRRAPAPRARCRRPPPPARWPWQMATALSRALPSSVAASSTTSGDAPAGRGTSSKAVAEDRRDLGHLVGVGRGHHQAHPLAAHVGSARAGRRRRPRCRRLGHQLGLQRDDLADARARPAPAARRARRG